ncbi:MAG: glycosyltransferase [Nitrospirae bacterium]|nr:glycosyltransferase [Nitrospirota bacterium]
MALKFDTPRHILWIRTDSIGDNVIAASMLGAVRNKFKSARITVLCQDHIAELYDCCPYIDHVVSFNKTLAYTDDHYREVMIRRTAALDVDIAMNSVFSRELIGDIFATRSRARLRVGFLGDLCNIGEDLRSANNCYYTALLPLPPSFTPEIPEIERHADFLRYFGIEPEAPLHPAVWTTPEDERFADEFFDRNNLHTAHTLAVAPGSQNDYKIYPFFSEVLKEFTEFKLIILGGVDTVNVSGEIFENFKGTCHNLTGKSSLRQTAAILRRCRHLLSSDSAAAHIATAVGTQNVVVLGGGHFGRFFPYSKLTTAVCLPLECYGCWWRCRFEEKHCITGIAPQVVASALDASLRMSPDSPQIAAQGDALWHQPQPLWHSPAEFLDTAHVNIKTYNEIPVRQRELISPASEFPETAINENAAVSAIVENLKTASSQEETLSLYKQYLERLPFDLNAAQSADTLRLEILRKRLPKITIVTPSYNQSAYLEECILSILTQGYPNLEYIIMDGGSTDNSVEIIKKYERHIGYWKSAPDSGQYAAIDEGFKRSTGEIMGWLNSDDKLHAGALWIVSLVFSAFSKIQWIMGRPTVWDADGTLSTVLSPIPLWSRSQYLKGHIGPPHIQQESTFWRRQLWEAAGGYIDAALKYAGDMELWSRFFRIDDLYSIDALIGGIRNHPAQKTAKKPSSNHTSGGYYDYGDYNSEADVIIARETAIYNNSPSLLYPPHDPVPIINAAFKSHDLIRTENFSCFTYSKQFHRVYFTNAGTYTYDASIGGYRYNLMAAFITSNLPKGGKLLIVSGGGASASSLIDLAGTHLTGEYEIWAVGHNCKDKPTHGIICIDGKIAPSNSPLPLNYFDLAVAEAPCEGQCDEIEQMIKTGANALFFFDVAVTGGAASVSAVLSYVFSKPHTVHPYVDISQLVIDPGALLFDRGDGSQTLSYNVLWKKIGGQPAPAATPAATSHSFSNCAPLVTVAAFAYHSPQFIEETLGDLAHQTIGNSIELVIVDASPDGNKAGFLTELRKIVKNTVLIDAPVESSTAAMWNIALRASNGEFITHLPKNSRLGGDALEAMSSALRENPDAALVYGNTYLTIGSHESFEFHHFCGIIQNPDSTYERLAVDSNLGPHPMWRRAVHDVVGYIDTEQWCERGLWLKIAERYKVLYLPASTGLMMNIASAPISGALKEIHAKYQKRYFDALRQKLAAFPEVPVFIWGAGCGGHETYDMLAALPAAVSGFIDGNPLKWHTKTKGLEIIPPDEIRETIEAGSRPFIVISSMYDSEIRPVLEGWGYVSRENYWTNIFRFKYATGG